MVMIPFCVMWTAPPDAWCEGVLMGCPLVVVTEVMVAVPTV